MNSLYLIRHGKAGWQSTQLSDFERQLTDKGRRQAEEMAARLQQNGVMPDLIVSSPAYRALETAEIFAEKFDYPAERIVREAAIYDGDIEHLAGIVRALPREKRTVLMVGHNPGLSQFGSWLSGKLLGQMTTCGIVQIGFSREKWGAIREESGTAIWAGHPREAQ